MNYLNRILIENMLRFGPKTLTNFEKANLRRSLLESDQILTLDNIKPIYWRSCDGHDNILVDADYPKLKIINPGPPIKVTFTDEPVSKGEKDSEYSIQSCVVGKDKIKNIELILSKLDGNYYLEYQF